MNLVIRAKALKNEPLSQAITGQFDERGGTIGRSDSNTMTLPDAERHVSRLQAKVSFADGAFSIRNVGSANPIVVNGRPVDPGEDVGLADGDEMVIGGYALRVELGGGAAGARRARAAVDPRSVIAASAREARTGPPQPGADPFADLLGAPAAPTTSTTPAFRPAADARARLPDDFDPFADLAPPAHAAGDAAADDMAGFMAGNSAAAPDAAARRDAPSSGAAGVADLLGLHAATPGLDTMFGLDEHAPSASDPFADFLAPPGGEPAPAAFDHTPELAGAYSPPAVRSPPRNRPAPRRAEAPPQLEPAPRGASPDALWAAFCEGAGLATLPLPLPQGLDAELMRLIGQLLHGAVEGTLKLSALRTAAKQELRAQVTTIQAKHNNPLKFAADARAALAQLLQPPMRGFLAGPEAMHDAMDDLLGHGIGTMAGTRAALQGLLARFEPAQLEARLAGPGVVGALVPMHRRARLWELYLQHYKNIRDEARDDFQELFGRAFVKAYEEQIERLAASRRPPPPPR